MHREIILNGFKVAPALAELMLRPDWSERRTGATWLERFPTHPDSQSSSIPFVQFVRSKAPFARTKRVEIPSYQRSWENQAPNFRQATSIRQLAI